MGFVNPRRGLIRAAVLPDSPSEGLHVFHTVEDKEYIFRSGRWYRIDGITSLYPAGLGVEPLRAVRIESGIAVLSSPDDMVERVHGIVSAVFDGLADVQETGALPGFTNLVENKRYCVGLGGVVTDEDEIPVGLPKMFVGYAVSMAILMIRLQPILGGSARFDTLTTHTLLAGRDKDGTDDNAEHVLHGLVTLTGAIDTILLRVEERAEILDLLSAARLEVGLMNTPDPGPYDDPHEGIYEADPYTDVYQGGVSPPEWTGFTVDEAGNVRTSGWVLIKHSVGGVILRAPNGLYYSFGIDAAGILGQVGTLIGPTPP